jgi:leukotriene-A4 hydrolase
MAVIDPHSYYDANQPRTRHLHLNWFTNFECRQIHGSVTLELERPSAGLVDLDTKGLVIRSANAQDGEEIPCDLGVKDPILGCRLRLKLPEGTTSVTIDYITSNEAIALQWLEPVMTRGKRHPFMYSQCQPIHARTIVPCQDTPCVRITYLAAVTVPEPLAAPLSAGPAGVMAGKQPGTRTFFFEMPQFIGSRYETAVDSADVSGSEPNGSPFSFCNPLLAGRSLGGDVKN